MNFAVLLPDSHAGRMKYLQTILTDKIIVK